ncbi:MAG: hypothetical protein IJ416_11600 [Ruminiclostridium sp.]|nr:hypothetical protein [Ruminiclostridium sp.]
MGIIDDFFNGNLCPADIQITNPRYMVAMSRQEQFLKTLSENLSEDDRQTLEKLMKYCSDMEYEHGRNMFALGFSMGVRFTGEGFSMREKNFP